MSSHMCSPPPPHTHTCTFPGETEFRSFGVGVCTTESVASGPLILKHIGKASALMDRIRGVQGDFDDTCKVVATMVNATGLHASEIVAISQKDIRPFESRVLKAIWGASRPGRAKEILFCLMCKGHRIAPSLLVPYGCAVWLGRLCKTRGPAMIRAQAVWEENPLTRKSGPFGRALKTLHDWGRRPLSDWWEWKVPGATDALQLTGDFKLVKHNIREQLRSQQITQLIARRLRQFAGMHYHTNRRLVCASIVSFQSEQERSLLRTLLAGGLWTAIRAHQRGMITSQCCPYCKQADETELQLAAARDLYIANVCALAAKVPDLPPCDRWPPCSKISGLLPEIEPPVNRQSQQHNLPFIQALHAMFVAILAARKLQDQKAPKLFPTVRPQGRSAYPYHQLVGPMPPPPRRARYAYTTPPHAAGHGKSPFWQTYWLGCGRYSGRKTQTQCPSLSWRSV